MGCLGYIFAGFFLLSGIATLIWWLWVKCAIIGKIIAIVLGLSLLVYGVNLIPRK